jgi:uncharacterized tellurite resistance protein B-like protein
MQLEPVSMETAEAALHSTQETAALVSRQYDRERRLVLATHLYQLARSDGTVSLHEEQLMGRAGQLLGLLPEDLLEARRRSEIRG